MHSKHITLQTLHYITLHTARNYLLVCLISIFTNL